MELERALEKVRGLDLGEWAAKRLRGANRVKPSADAFERLVLRVIDLMLAATLLASDYGLASPQRTSAPAGPSNASAQPPIRVNCPPLKINHVIIDPRFASEGWSSVRMRDRPQLWADQVMAEMFPSDLPADSRMIDPVTHARYQSQLTCRYDSDRGAYFIAKKSIYYCRAEAGRSERYFLCFQTLQPGMRIPTTAEVTR